MNARDAAVVIRDLLAAAVWPGVGGETVFPDGSVIVSDRAPSWIAQPARSPVALIGIGPAVHDEEHPQLVVQTFTVTVCCSVPGESNFENAMIGANQPSALSSRGRGVAEIVPRVMEEVGTLDNDDGLSIVGYAVGDALIETVDETGYSAFQVLTLEAQIVWS